MSSRFGCSGRILVSGTVALAGCAKSMFRPYFSSGYLVLRFFLALALGTSLTFGAAGNAKRRPLPRRKIITSVRAAVGAPVVRGGPWTEPTFADSTAGDFIDGEDPEVRRAAVEALGPYN